MVADRAVSANVTQGVILFLCFLGGSFLGSPAARCILAVPLAFSKYCMERCATWQRSACVMIVFTIGPTAELYDTYTLMTAKGSNPHPHPHPHAHAHPHPCPKPGPNPNLQLQYDGLDARLSKG